ncbi:MAG: type III pantothenate kinase [Oscillospiraceae bacterium]|nr:type III pantothenate kinase [Oscillospiraceae bacterium]
MLLCVDIGNTNIVLGCFRDDDCIFLSRISTDKARLKDQYAVDIGSILSLYCIEPSTIDDAIISSVVPSLTEPISYAIELVTGSYPMVLNPGLKTGLNIRIDNPAQLGSDFVACAVAAKEKYPLPLVIIDMGTATTVSAVAKNGDFLGCAILPGLRISTDALVERTSLLTSISYEAPKSAIGGNTNDSMQSGVIYGAAAMIDGLCNRFFEELGEVGLAIATGGLAVVVTPYCKTDIMLDNMLLLNGLKSIYWRNKKK